jgi:hypothetical protein
MATYTVTVRCHNCRTTYMVEKWSNASVGQVTTPNAGLKCPGCQGTGPATVVASQKVGN